MSEILIQAVAQVPALVVLCLLVHVFLNTIKSERTALEAIATEALDRNTDALAANARIIQEATESLKRNTEMLGRISAVIERLEKRDSV